MSLACGIAPEAEIQARFQKEHPTYVITSSESIKEDWRSLFEMRSSIIGPEDSDLTGFRISYRKPADKKLFQTTWIIKDRRVFERREEQARSTLTLGTAGRRAKESDSGGR